MQDKKFYRVPLYDVINYQGEIEFVDFIVVTKTFLGVEEVVTKSFFRKANIQYPNHIDTKYIDFYQLSYYGSQLVVLAKDLNQKNKVEKKEVDAWINSSSSFQMFYKKREEEREKIFQKVR